MSYKSRVLDGLYVVRWGAEKPHLEDIGAYAGEIAMARAQQRKRLIGIFIMPADHGTPDEAFRRAQANKLPEIMANLDFAVAVFEGEGFLSSLKRSALVGILLLAPKRFSISVRATVEEALISNPPGVVPFDATKAIEKLKAEGIVTR